VVLQDRWSMPYSPLWFLHPSAHRMYVASSIWTTGTLCLLCLTLLKSSDPQEVRELIEPQTLVLTICQEQTKRIDGRSAQCGDQLIMVYFLNTLNARYKLIQGSDSELCRKQDRAKKLATEMTPAVCLTFFRSCNFRCWRKHYQRDHTMPDVTAHTHSEATTKCCGCTCQ
jgi:hypothetical protein